MYSIIFYPLFCHCYLSLLFLLLHKRIFAILIEWWRGGPLKRSRSSCGIWMGFIRVCWNRTWNTLDCSCRISSPTILSTQKYIENVVLLLTVWIWHRVEDAWGWKKTCWITAWCLISDEFYGFWRVPILIEVSILFILQQKCLYLFLNRCFVLHFLFSNFWY